MERRDEGSGRAVRARSHTAIHSSLQIASRREEERAARPGQLAAHRTTLTPNQCMTARLTAARLMMKTSGRAHAFAAAAPLPAAALSTPPAPTVVPLARDVTPVRLVRRYKRFLADVLFPGEATAVTTVHCPNTGPMTGLLPPLLASDGGPGAPPAPGAVTFPAFVSTAPNGGAGRKYPHTLEAIAPLDAAAGEDGSVLVGVHSAAANRVVAALAALGALDGCGLPALGAGRAEVPYAAVRKGGSAKAGPGPASRADFCFALAPEAGGGGGPGGGPRELVVEVKSVTLASPPVPPSDSRVALFPDTVSVRAARHAADLAAVARSTGASGRGAAAVFLIQRGDAAAFAPCHACDPAYGAALVAAAADGVLLVALRASIAFQPPADGVGEGGGGGDGGGGGGTLLLSYLGPAPIDLQHGLAEVRAAEVAAAAAPAGKAGGPKAKKARK